MSRIIVDAVMRMTPDAVLEAFELHEDKEYQCSRGHRHPIHADSDGHADSRHHPYAGGSGEASDRAFHLYDRACAEEADTGDDLCGYTPRVAVLESEILLWHID